MRENERVFDKLIIKVVRLNREPNKQDTDPRDECAVISWRLEGTDSVLGRRGRADRTADRNNEVRECSSKRGFERLTYPRLGIVMDGTSLVVLVVEEVWGGEEGDWEGEGVGNCEGDREEDE